MSSEQKIASARVNGARSRGPATPDGKRRALRSNVDQGMLARTVVLSGESPERFQLLMTSLREELHPETAIENLLIDKLAVAHWRLMRVWAMESAALPTKLRPLKLRTRPRGTPSLSAKPGPT